MTPRHDDPGHDAWLREALRHAPDADIAAPPAVSDTILRQARAATVARVAPAAAPRTAASHGGLQDVLASFWAWLARPGVATGFASVMVATVVGMLWWGRPMDEAAMPRPPDVGVETRIAEVSASTPAAKGKADADAAAEPAAQDTARAAATDPKQMRPAPRDQEVANAQAPRPAEVQPKRQVSAAAAPKATAGTAGQAAPAGALEGAPTPLPRRPDAETAVARNETITAPSPAPATAVDVAAAIGRAAPPRADGPADRPAAPAELAMATPRPLPEATAIALPPSPPAATAAASPPSPPAATRAAPAVAADDAAAPQALAGADVRARRDTESRAKAAPRELAPPPMQTEPRVLADTAGAARVAAAPAAPAAALASSAVAAPWRALRRSVAADPERWSWQRGDGVAQPMTPALLAWLAGLGEEGAAVASRRAEAVPPPLRLLRDGRLHSSLVLGGDHLQLLPADTARPALSWPLAPATAAALRDALDAATR